MMQRRRTKLSPRGIAFAGAASAEARRRDPGGSVMSTPDGPSQTSQSVKPAGSLPHFARQTKSSLQRNAQRACDVRVRAPFSKLSENQTPTSSSTKNLDGTKVNHAIDKTKIVKTPKTSFLSSFGAKRPSAVKDQPGESGLAGPIRAASHRGFMGISPPWHQKGVNQEKEPSPKATTESQEKICPPQRLIVDTTSQSAPRPEIDTVLPSERLGISPVWAQQQECFEEGTPSDDPTPVVPGAGNVDGTTPSSATLSTLLGVFSTFADVWVHPALDETASTESVEDIPSSVLVRPRESLGGVSEISDGSASVSLDESSEIDDDESSSSTSRSMMSSLASSAAQSLASRTADVLSIGGSDRHDCEEEEDDNEALLQLPEGLRLPSRAFEAATPGKELQEAVHSPTEEVELSTSALILSPPQTPSVAMEQYQHRMPSICVGRLLQSADDDSSEDMSTSTLKSELEKYMKSIFSPVEPDRPCDELDSRNLTALHVSFFDDEDPRFTIDGVVDDSVLMSDEQLLQELTTFDETPAIDDAVRMFSTEEFDSVALFADLSEMMDDSVFSVVSDPLLQLVQSNCAFLDETQRKLLSDHSEEAITLGTTDGGQQCTSPSSSLERRAWRLTPDVESDIDNSSESHRTENPLQTILAVLAKKSCDGEELEGPKAPVAAVELSPQHSDRDSSPEKGVLTNGEVPPPPLNPVDSSCFSLSREGPHEQLDTLETDVLDQRIQQVECSTDELLLREFEDSTSRLETTPADEIRELRKQVELLTKTKGELECLLKIAVRELVATSDCYTSEGEALAAIYGKARETTAIEESSVCFPQTTVQSLTLDDKS